MISTATPSVTPSTEIAVKNGNRPLGKSCLQAR